ncbi:TetR/AcrR family transcriptional regulator [Brasilonema sp. UFV-L1]|uniref:TetR/AcrR family transcriptional regulator n=1 Tax=Brasilonema sp. UFV-L1 TaxID=2234130 RepID=UPI00145E8756|nr:TetR/AcrR family transcriptional regulator [Brasilonema sp. UFV-L1]NMG07818.1 TetR/AcrR family transcriptional regulator [Brasilonema sp. UFV-L1]
MPDDSLSPKEVSCNGRERILDQAERLFRTQGYNTVTMRDIAREAGIRQASLYYHFSSKEQLFVGVTERMFERHRTGLQQAIQDAGGELQTQLHAVSTWFLSQPPIHFLSMFHTDMPLLGEENIKRLSACAEQSIFEPIRQVFTEAQERTEIRDDVRPKMLTGFFLSCLESIPYVTKLPDTASGEVIVNEIISVLLNGIKPQQ